MRDAHRRLVICCILETTYKAPLRAVIHQDIKTQLPMQRI